MFKVFDNEDTSRVGYVYYENKEEDKMTKNLYEVITITLEGEIEIDELVVAKNEEEAKFNAGVYAHLDGSGLNLDDINVVVKLIQSGIRIKEDSYIKKVR